MSDDQFAADDAAYVLGALPPDARQRFEEHLQHCDRCARAVSDLAGMPGLLSRAGATDAPQDPAPPPDLLPQLITAAKRTAGRRRLAASAGWIVAAACVAGIGVAVLSPEATGPAGTTFTPMTVVVDAPVDGWAGLTGVAWGTRIEVRCRYRGTYSVGTYSLRIIAGDGSREQLGSWKVVPDATITVTAATHLAAADIGRLQIVASDGTAVLDLQP